MTSHVIILWRSHETSLRKSVSAMCFLIEIMYILIRSYFIGLNDKQNLMFMVISSKIYETHQRLISYEMTTRVRSALYIKPDTCSNVCFLKR